MLVARLDEGVPLQERNRLGFSAQEFQREEAGHQQHQKDHAAQSKYFSMSAFTFAPNR
jgi:hypothetical protein